MIRTATSRPPHAPDFSAAESDFDRELRALHATAPVIDLRLRLVLGVAVVRLQLAFKLLAVAVDFGEFVVSELAPLRFDFSRKLLPVSFDSVPIHLGFSFLRWGLIDPAYRTPSSGYRSDF